MAVRIMVDDLGLCPADGAEAVLSPEVNALHAVRERIRHRLCAPEPTPLVLRMSSAIFRRFADLEGQPGLVVQRPPSASRERKSQWALVGFAPSCSRRWLDQRRRPLPFGVPP